MLGFFPNAILALAMGGLIGLERERAGHTAGVRSFAITALLGMLASSFENKVVFSAVGLGGVFLLSAMYYYTKPMRAKATWGITTPLMLPFTFMLGILVGFGYPLEAGALAIAAVYMLVEKREVHAMAERVSKEEVIDLLLFAVIAFVVYPQLPAEPVEFMGASIDLHFFWTAVVLITAISFVAHVLLKFVGQKAVIYASFLGGAISSLATSAMFAGKTRDPGVLRLVLVSSTAGSVASDIAFLAFMAPALLAASIPLNAVFLLGLLALTWYYLRKADAGKSALRASRHPLSLRFIIEFAGALFIVNSIMGVFAHDATGLYASALLGGVASSTAVFASLAYLHSTGAVGSSSAVVALFLALASSLAVKTVVTAYAVDRKASVIRPALVALAFAALGLYLNLFIR